jgi:hypothetical protein
MLVRKKWSASSLQTVIHRELIQKVDRGEKYFILNDLLQNSENNHISLIAAQNLAKMMNHSEISSFLDRLKDTFPLTKNTLKTGIVIIILGFILHLSTTMFHVISHPFSDFKANYLTIRNLTSAKEIFKGDSVRFKVLVNPANVDVRVKVKDPYTDQILFSESLQYEDSLYVSPFVPVTQNLAYYFDIRIPEKSKDEHFLSKTYYLYVKTRPTLDFITFNISPPGYTGMPPFRLFGEKSVINVPEFSKIQMHIHSTDTLNKIELFLNNRISKQRKDIKARNCSYTVNIRDSAEISIRFQVSNSKKWFEHPLRYMIVPVKDRTPSVNIVSSQKEFPLNDQLSARFLLDLKDDYGFQSLQAYYVKVNSDKVKAKEGKKLPIKADLDPQKNNQKLFVDISLFKIFPLPDDKFRIWFVVQDNNPFRKQTGISDTVVVYVPSLDNMITQNEQILDSARSKKEELLEKIRKNMGKLETIKKQFLKKGKLDPRDKNQLKEIARDIEDLQKEIKQIADQLERSVNSMQKQNVFSEETLKKYMELQRMFSEAATDELKKLMEKLQELMKKESFIEKKNQFNNTEFSLEEFEKQINRLYELFKETEAERKLDELLEYSKMMQTKLEKIIGQNEIKPRLLKRVVENHKNFLNLSKLVSQQLQDTDQESALKLDSLATDVRSKRFSEKLNQQLSHPEQANPTLKSMEQSYESTSRELEDIKSQFMNRKKNQIQFEVKSLITDLFYITSKQEKFEAESRGVNRFSDFLPELSLRQNKLHALLKNVEVKLLAISKKTFLFNPMIYQFIRRAGMGMEQNVKDIEERRTFKLQNNSREIRKNVNLGIYLLLEMNQQIAQSQSGTGLQEFLKQMEQLIKQQAGINQQTMDLFQQLRKGGRLSPSQRNALRQLREQQEAIQRSMEYMRSGIKAGNKGIDNQLKGIREELKHVVDDLKRYRLNRKLIERQQKILNRMLSATQSIREKDISKKRKAEIGKEYEVKSPVTNPKNVYYQNQIIEFLKEMDNMKLDPSTKRLLKNYYENILSK